MTAVLLGLVAGGAGGALAWRTMSPLWASPTLERENYRGHRLPVAGGLALVVATIIVVAAFSSAKLIAGAGPPERSLVATALVVLGFGILGLIDDLVGDRGERSFRGHLRAALAGRLTTGGLKLVGGGMVALLAAAAAVPADGADLLFDGLLIALMANAVNLFDLAPGRAAKAGLLGFAVVVLAAGSTSALAGPAVVAGATMALIVPDLREQMMLGDTGANPLGAALGLAVVLVAGPAVRNVVLVLLVALNLASERVSFSRLIERVAPLRAFDRIGRRR